MCFRTFSTVSLNSPIDRDGPETESRDCLETYITYSWSRLVSVSRADISVSVSISTYQVSSPAIFTQIYLRRFVIKTLIPHKLNRSVNNNPCRMQQKSTKWRSFAIVLPLSPWRLQLMALMTPRRCLELRNVSSRFQDSRAVVSVLGVNVSSPSLQTVDPEIDRFEDRVDRFVLKSSRVAKTIQLAESVDRIDCQTVKSRQPIKRN